MPNILQAYDPNVLFKGGHINPFSKFMAGRQEGLARRDARERRARRQELEGRENMLFQQAEDERLGLAGVNEFFGPDEFGSEEHMQASLQASPTLRKKMYDRIIEQKYSPEHGRLFKPQWVDDPEDENYQILMEERFNKKTGERERISKPGMRKKKSLVDRLEWYREKYGKEALRHLQEDKRKERKEEREITKEARNIEKYNRDMALLDKKIELLKKGGNYKPNQYQAALYGNRMEMAAKTMRRLANTGFKRSSLKAGVFNSLLPNQMKSKEMQVQNQAERNFVNAVLRRESGAAIAPSEFESAELQYFPRAGDKPEVLEQKRQARLAAIAGMKMESGGAWDETSGEISKTVKKPKAPSQTIVPTDADIDNMTAEQLKAFLGQ